MDDPAVAETVRSLQRRFGATALRRGEDALEGEAWPTGVPALDGTLTPGGLPRGRLSVLAAAGRGTSGRLTLLQALAARASRSLQVVYVDLTGTLDPGFLADLGADLPACLVVRPPREADAASGLVMARALVAAGAPWVAVAMGEARGARPGRRWETALTTLVEAVWRARAVACVASPAPVHASLAYASSLTLRCTPLGWQQAHGDVTGLRLQLETVKCKVAAPGATAAVLLRYPRPHAHAEVVGFPAVVAVPREQSRRQLPPAAALAG